MTSLFVGPIYRHVSKESYADQFVDGESIRVSTFQTCREYEDDEQGDAEEGHLHYVNTHITDEHPGFNEIAAKFKLEISGVKDVILNNNRLIQVVDDAYVICFSVNIFDECLKKKFGDYPVRVNNISSFAGVLLHAMRKAVNAQFFMCGMVNYKDRLYKDFESPPGHVCFLKPSVPFSAQREFRFVIMCPPGHIYKPFNLKVAMPSGLCVRMS
ncbi:hypothetical protein [Pseudomonas syringae]|uniref:hypothetical protein n=1 Tax=Pseudomonas syringae TaxID=317 RepID=UPI0018E5BBEC|nr:hypothetical protein [Pseudomonas syringae]MBI6745960.1 hypothetical protein [Pseudomonas syringae]MBI6760375.1 hypothetical protein [Pseudomonas syringae]MBI6829476.1 hypothetical protein [Pseudomonas syringae]